MRLLLVTFLSAYALPAITLNPVKWSLSAEPAAVDGGDVLLKLHAEIAAGFHLYSLTTPPGGPIRTRVRILGEGTTATEGTSPSRRPGWIPHSTSTWKHLPGRLIF